MSVDRATLVMLCVCVGLTIGLASEPGEPLDCSDMVFGVPGLTCRVFAPFGLAEDDPLWIRGTNLAVDNEGNLLSVHPIPVDGSWVMERVEVISSTGLEETRLSFIPGNRIAPAGRDGINARKVCSANGCGNFAHHAFAVHFDPVSGRLLVWLDSFCFNSGCPGDYGGGRWIAAIEGFTTLHEIRDSYSPPLDELSFRVPVIPEGFDAADFFDSYWGTLSSVGDWSKATPLQCGYPAGTPAAGDYLTVPDSLPTPEPGEGYYYVTAVTYAGETRYGRMANGGVLSGRDPAVLPACE